MFWVDGGVLRSWKGDWVVILGNLISTVNHWNSKTYVNCRKKLAKNETEKMRSAIYMVFATHGTPTLLFLFKCLIYNDLCFVLIVAFLPRFSFVSFFDFLTFCILLIFNTIYILVSLLQLVKRVYMYCIVVDLCRFSVT